MAAKEWGGRPVAIDAERGLWEAEALLAKLVPFEVKGSPHGDNTCEKWKNMSPELVKEFEATLSREPFGRAITGEANTEWKG